MEWHRKDKGRDIKVTDYFFISSPLHFCIAANIAIQNPTHKNVAVIISKNVEVGNTYASAAKHCPQIFNKIIPLTASVTGGRLISRKGKVKILKQLFSKQLKIRIFTGNDRRIEFQYAMHISTKSGTDVEGIYMDDGAVTYVGHKSMNKIQHRYVDPLFKKLFYGFWWKNAVTTGTSTWIETAYVAFPDAVHPLLRDKRLIALDAEVFKSDQFIALTSHLLDSDKNPRKLLAGVKVVLTLPDEAGFLERQKLFQDVFQQLGCYFEISEIAVKAHPRSKKLGIMENIFSGVILIDSSLGMEILLPLLDEGCLVVGDVSSTLLTTRWMRPDLPVVAIKIKDEIPILMMDLYNKLQIEMIDVRQLKDSLSGIIGDNKKS